MYIIIAIIIVLNLYGIVWFLTYPKPELAPEIQLEPVSGKPMPVPPFPMTQEINLATHEAGHTVVAWWCSGVASVPSVTIENEHGGITFVKYTNFINAWCLLVIDLAGLAAEAFSLKKAVRSKPASDDLSKALQLAHDISINSISPPWSSIVGPSLPFEKMFTDISDAEVNILKQAYTMARKLIEKHSIEYYKLVSLLLQKKTVSETDVSNILNSRSRIVLYGKLAREAKFL